MSTQLQLVEALDLLLYRATWAAGRGMVEESRDLLRWADRLLVVVERLDPTTATAAVRERYRQAVCAWVQAAIRAREEVHP